MLHFQWQNQQCQTWTIRAYMAFEHQETTNWKPCQLSLSWGRRMHWYHAIRKNSLLVREL